MLYAYVRVSRKEQSLDRQINNLMERYNPELKRKNIFCDKQSGKNFDRTNYIKLKKKVKRGDEIIVHELDRFGRNKKEIKIELEKFRSLGVIPRILNIPTTLYSYPKDQHWLDEMINNILIEVYSTLAEQERETISRRTKEGLAVARKKGRIGGRPRIEKKRIKKALCMYKEHSKIENILNECKIGRGTLYNYLKATVFDLTKNHSINEISTITGVSIATIKKYLE